MNRRSFFGWLTGALASCGLSRFAPAAVPAVPVAPVPDVIWSVGLKYPNGTEQSVAMLGFGKQATIPPNTRITSLAWKVLHSDIYGIANRDTGFIGLTLIEGETFSSRLDGFDGVALTITAKA